jgi:OPA family glycerol-3-phosphate transporter-like MFS transporter 3
MPFYAFLWCANGLAQSLGWPANVAVMGNWFVGGIRGGVFGVWSGCASFGNIVGTGMVVAVLACFGSAGWRAAMLLTAAMMGVQGALVLAFLRPQPPPEAEAGAADEAACAPAHRPPPISPLAALRIPGVMSYSLSYAFLKGTNYAFFFWLPTYLYSAEGMSGARADLFSMLYDVGQILGGFVAGLLTDRMSDRGPLTAGMLLLSAPLVWLMQFCRFAQLGVMLPLVGFMLGGPANMIAGCIAADLGQHRSLRQNERALATVTGIIDGSGSVGAAAAQLVVGALAPAASAGDAADWRPVFAFLCACDAVAVLCLLPVLRPWLRRARRRVCRGQLSTLELGADGGLARHDAATIGVSEHGAPGAPPSASPLPQHRI